MKFIFICLLIINAVLFVLWGGYVDHRHTASDQSRLLQQQNSAQLKLVSAQAANTVVLDTAVVVEEPENKPAESASVACLAWGAFPESALKKVDAKLKSLSLKNPPVRQQTQTQIQETNSTIVLIPSLDSKEAADKKVAELTKLGVKDFYILHDQSDQHWGISLGVFKSEEAAKQLLATMVNIGVKDVRMKPHVLPNATAKSRFNYVFNNLSSEEQAGLENLKKVFPAQELRVCK